MALCCRAADVAVKESHKEEADTSEAVSDTSEDSSEDEDVPAAKSGTPSRAHSRTSHRPEALRKSSDMRDMIATGLKSFTSSLMKSFTSGRADVVKELTAGEKAAEERAKVPHWQQAPSAKEMRAKQQAQLEAKRLKEEQEQADRVHHNTLDGRSVATSRQTSINNHTAAFSRQASHSTHAAINSHAPSTSTSRRASVADHVGGDGAGGGLPVRAYSRQRSNSSQLPALTPAPAGLGRLPSIQGNSRMPPLETATLSTQTRVLSPTTSAAMSRPGSGNPDQLSLVQHHHGLAMISLGGMGVGVGAGAGMGAGLGMASGMAAASRPTSGVVSTTPLSPTLSRQASGAAYRGLTQYDPNTDYLSMLSSSANNSQAHSAGMLSKSGSLNDHTAPGRGVVGMYGTNKSLKQRFADMPHLPGVMEEGAADLGSGRLA